MSKIGVTCERQIDVTRRDLTATCWHW